MVTGSILIVEDNDDSRLLLSRTLRKLGCTRISLAEDGAVAVDLLARQRFDVIFLDLHMPRLDGYGVLDAISSSENDPGDVAVILTTASNDPDDVSRAIRKGSRHYLPKPFTPEEVAQVLRRSKAT